MHRTPVMLSALTVVLLRRHVRDAESGQAVAQAVPVEAELALLERLPRRGLLGAPRGGRLDAPLQVLARAHHAPVVVADDRAAGPDELPADRDGHVDRPRGGLDRALRADGGAPGGEAHGPQVGHVTYPGV